MTITVPIYSEQPLSRDAQAVIQQVLKEYPPNTFEFKDVNGGVVYNPNNPNTDKLLVFGRVTVKLLPSWQLIHTYSIAQIVTKANAATVLKAALDQFYIPQKKHPTKPGPLRGWRLSDFDLTAPIAIDIETSGNLDVETPESVGILTISFYQNGKWACWNLKNAIDASGLGMFAGEGWLKPFYIDVLRRIEKGIFHNGKFDIRVIEAVFGVRVPNYFDTMLAHHALNQAAGDHKLKHLCRQYLGAPEWEADLSRWTVGGAHYENIPNDILIEYNLWDVYWTWELWKWLEPQILINNNAANVFMLEMAAADMLLEVEQKGFAIDVGYTQTLELQMQVDLSKLLTDLQNMAVGVQYKNNKPFNPASWQQVQKVLSHLSGIHYTDSTNEKHLLAFRDGVALKMGTRKQLGDTQDFIDKLLEYRGVAKALSTYVSGALKVQKNGRVHTTFLIHGTSTGRLSSSGPNLQNIPRDKKFRRIYVSAS